MKTQFLTFCLLACLSISAQDTIQIHPPGKNFEERIDFASQNTLAYVNGDTIPFTGTVVFIDSRKFKSSECTYLNGLKEKEIRYHQGGEGKIRSVTEYIEGKKKRYVWYYYNGVASDSVIYK